MKSIISNVPGNNNPNKVERETIHSGHFMVSTFEAEEAQDDLDDSEVKMPDPEDPSLVKPGESNTCMEVQLYVPRKVTQQQNLGYGNSVEIVTSHLEIETSLTKLFKCMNLAYSQKLTSPKWNHFKGVRLRWKDKIRLNNVIWRCWHMQFILKRKTLVCQFASPLDVDIHSNPESVVLEGKYWKRQLAVIKAEYRKWRRNYKSTMMGFLTYDTKSEFDFFDWSPINDKHLITNEDWTTDTLFAAINVPFPFPDSREIARGAGIADFIQPSLGPLQPNLDDIDLTFVELLQNTRLPSVPEEGTDEILRNVDYNFSDIMGSDQMNGNSLINVSASNAIETTPSTNTPGDTNMMELGTPLNALQYVHMEQQIPSTNNITNNAQTIKVTGQTEEHFNLTNKDTIMSESNSVCVGSGMLQQKNCPAKKQYIGNSVDIINNITGPGCIEVRHGNSNDFHVRKGRISKISQRSFRREPHNYDKAQPTIHQTNIYQQILAEQQKLQQSSYAKQESPSTSSIISPAQQQNLGDHLSYDDHTTNFTSHNSNNDFEENDSEAVARITENSNDSRISLVDLITDNVASSSTLTVPSQSQQRDISAQNVKIETTSTEVLTMFNVSTSRENGTINYKSHPHIASFKKSASTGNYFNLCMTQCQTPNQNTYISSEVNVQEQMPFQFTNIRTTFNGQQQTQPEFLPASIDSQAGMLSNEMPLIMTTPSNIAPCQRSLSSIHLNSLSQQTPSSVPISQVSLSLNQSAQSMHAATKEMYRSNSLPLNVALPKIAQMDQFVMPKYPQQHLTGKSAKGRVRSNSIHHQHYNHINSQINVKAMKPVGNHIIKMPIGIATSNNMTTPLKTTTSEPILNSTISQLLAIHPHLTKLPKQQSASNIAITNTELSTMQNKFMTKGIKGSVYKLSSDVPMDIQLSTTIESGDMISRHCLKHSGEIQDQQQPPHKSPKKSIPMETNILSSSAATAAAGNANKNIINYPTTLSKTGQLGGEVNSNSGSMQNQIFIQTADMHPELNVSATSATAAATLSPTQVTQATQSNKHSTRAVADNSQQRRFGHIHAEQKRRYNIKSGFDQLHDLIPQLQQHNVKLSKAAMLQKGVEHIKHLRNERNILKQQIDNLKLERNTLNNSLTHLQSILPANGSPVTRQGTENIRKFYEEYVQYRAKENWKFWILGLIMEPLLTSYTNSVSSANVDELRRTTFLWVDQHCSLVDLRPAVSNKLKYLSMTTDLLSDPPSTLKEEIEKAMANSNTNTNSSSQQHPNLHGS